MSCITKQQSEAVEGMDGGGLVIGAVVGGRVFVVVKDSIGPDGLDVTGELIKGEVLSVGGGITEAGLEGGRG